MRMVLGFDGSTAWPRRGAIANFALGSAARNVLAGSNASVLVMREASETDRDGG